MFEIKLRRLRSQIFTFSFFQFYFFKNHGFIERRNPSEKNVKVEEELNCIDIKDSPILVFIDEECGNLIVANDGGELTRNINQKKKSDALQQLIDVHSVTNVVDESISSVTMWNIYCKSVR